jgi:hypothetical protein
MRLAPEFTSITGAPKHSPDGTLPAFMNCTLLLPNLLPHGEGAQAAWQAVDAPHLKQLLARAELTAGAGHGALDTLCRLFTLQRNAEHDWPLAPLLAIADGVDTAQGFWFTATPVHLQTQRHGLTLSDPASLRITDAEAAAFAQTLSQHLAQEGITLHTPRADRWYLRCEQPQAVTTQALADAIGRDVRPSLPQGVDGRRWHRILTEIQMLLHNHGTNTLREARGMAPVNSVWLSLGGAVPEPCSTHFDNVHSDDPVARALAQHAAIPYQPLPHRFEASSGTPLYVFEALPQQDGEAWAQRVAMLEREWIAPMQEALHRGAVKKIALLSSSLDGARQFSARSGDKWKIWRKNNYL